MSSNPARLVTGTVDSMRMRLVDVPEDLEQVGALLARIEAVDGHQPIGEHKFLMLFQGDPEKVIGLVAENEGQVVSYIALTPNADPGWWGMELAVGPEHRSHEAYLELFQAGAAEVARRGGRAVRAWLFQPRLAEVALRAGFEPERELLKLVRQLPGGFDDQRPDAEFAPGVEMAAFVRGRDEDAWLAVNNAAFIDHPENGNWTKEVLEDRLDQDWFHAEDLLMAWRGEKLAGFCWVKRENDQGEIYVIAVAPENQGEGLGRTLVVRGLALMERKRDRMAYLYVDGSNHRALGLYRSLGFYVDHVDRSFVLTLA